MLASTAPQSFAAFPSKALSPGADDFASPDYPLPQSVPTGLGSRYFDEPSMSALPAILESPPGQHGAIGNSYGLDDPAPRAIPAPTYRSVPIGDERYSSMASPLPLSMTISPPVSIGYSSSGGEQHQLPSPAALPASAPVLGSFWASPPPTNGFGSFAPSMGRFEARRETRSPLSDDQDDEPASSMDFAAVESAMREVELNNELAQVRARLMYARLTLVAVD